MPLPFGPMGRNDSSQQEEERKGRGVETRPQGLEKGACFGLNPGRGETRDRECRSAGPAGPEKERSKYMTEEKTKKGLLD